MGSRGRWWLALAALAAVAIPWTAYAGFVDRARKTSDEDLELTVQRVELQNGLVLLLAPDPTVSGVAVWMSFRAGALYEPAGRSGLAHLVEHLMATGPGAETDYAGLLERRGARLFNASTGFDTMTFEAVLPAEELPAGLWVAAERLRALPQLMDEATVEQSRRVVTQERALRDVDAPYGLIREGLWQCLFRAPHPLHGGVIGLPQELASATASDVRAFAAEHLVPANGVLAVVGRFDPEVARRLATELLGSLPAGKRAPVPALPPLRPVFTGHQAEPLGREPHVILAWRFPGMLHDEADALRLGAQFLTFMTDGAWGMRISARLSEHVGEAMMTMELSVPYDEPQRVVQDDALGFLRMLTHKQVPPDMMDMGNLALDREALFDLDTLEGRAELLTHLELLGERSAASFLGSHWSLEGPAIQGVAWSRLRAPSVVLHARPRRPRPAHPERE